MKFKVGEDQYIVDRHGVVHQLNPKPFTYDKNYCATYDTEAYKRQSELLQAMRLAFASAVHGRPITSLCDVGFGNGAFLRFASCQISDLFGSDISGVALPSAVTFLSDVTTFPGVLTYWDCLEHIPDLSFLKHLKAETIVISLPLYPGQDAFGAWPHRKPGEHLHHFTGQTLCNFMHAMGWRMTATSKHEDIVRRRNTDWNILSAGFKRQ